ncbi:lysine--tRNA ligase [Kangiella sp.]|uniref:lysine--tRNA ligase n=1 Tax=Kangiella sp. TaxID=1920245 RepID=UPI0019C71A4A|nr:lysine--tRNA ligase [Kangiella sp.]MBD3654693.1 lysine--tRNA ligase [Kangiella sp.]
MSNQETPVVDVNEQITLRKQKLADKRKQGIAFPNDFRRDSLAEEIATEYGDKEKSELEELGKKVKVAGRIMLFRNMGKASFITIQDMSGRIQSYVRKDAVGDEVYEDFKTWDIGDIVGIEGTVFKTNKGELSVKASSIRLLTKSLRPLPDKWSGLSDQETRYRQRYVDLIVNQQSRETFIIRSRVVKAIRDFLESRDFLEVETPMMHVIPGGASARPFETHHNALDMPLYLRIAPELYLKRLVVGGLEKVFEINRNFRNEGLSTRHNPEFTMLEFYWAYADYNDLMDLTEAMLRYTVETVLGKTVFESGGETYNFGKPFERMTVLEAIMKYQPEITLEQLTDMDKAREVAKRLKLKLEDSWGLGRVQIEIFEEVAEHKLIQPTFITAYPAEVSPLARRNDEDPFITDRFEFFAGGRELANGFSELNDAEDQAQRFKEQVEAKDAGDDEAMHYDADYIRALEYGLPPTAGEGIGIDRLVMLLTDSLSIRDVLLFPHMRPE